MKITFWLRKTDRNYWKELRKKFKPSEIISHGIELAYLDLVKRSIRHEETQNGNDKS